MGSPFDAGRDSSAADSNAFAASSEVADSNQDAFQAAYATPPDQLAEHDYRSPEHVGSANNPVGTPHGAPPERPGEFGYPTARPGGSINLP